MAVVLSLGLVLVGAGDIVEPKEVVQVVNGVLMLLEVEVQEVHPMMVTLLGQREYPATSVVVMVVEVGDEVQALTEELVEQEESLAGEEVAVVQL
jgi:hypothetical protein